MYVRSPDKVAEIEAKCDIHCTSSEEEFLSLKPDYVVVAVSKNAGAKVAVRWLDRGYTVLLETPAGVDMEKALKDSYMAIDMKTLQGM